MLKTFDFSIGRQTRQSIKILHCAFKLIYITSIWTFWSTRIDNLVLRTSRVDDAHTHTANQWTREKWKQSVIVSDSRNTKRAVYSEHTHTRDICFRLVKSRDIDRDTSGVGTENRNIIRFTRGARDPPRHRPRVITMISTIIIGPLTAIVSD